MARITVEDCLEVIPNRFDLILAAAKRARTLEVSGQDPLVDPENDKSTVIALREIAAGHTNIQAKPAVREAVQEEIIEAEDVETAEAGSVEKVEAVEVTETETSTETTTEVETVELQQQETDSKE